jgi:hypothetical protein
MLNVTKNPQKTLNGAQFVDASKGSEMRPNEILRSKTPSLSVQKNGIGRLFGGNHSGQKRNRKPRMMRLIKKPSLKPAELAKPITK